MLSAALASLLAATPPLRAAGFDAWAAAHNTRGAALDARSAHLDNEGRRFNAAMVEHNGRCGGIAYRAEDRAAILAEREREREQQRRMAAATP